MKDNSLCKNSYNTQADFGFGHSWLSGTVQLLKTWYENSIIIWICNWPPNHITYFQLEVWQWSAVSHNTFWELRLTYSAFRRHQSTLTFKLRGDVTSNKSKSFATLPAGFLKTCHTPTSPMLCPLYLIVLLPCMEGHGLYKDKWQWSWPPSSLEALLTSSTENISCKGGLYHPVQHLLNLNLTFLADPVLFMPHFDKTTETSWILWTCSVS